MPRTADGSTPWLDREVRALLQNYRAADVVDAETAAVVERRLSRGSTEAALEKLLDATGS